MRQTWPTRSTKGFGETSIPVEHGKEPSLAAELSHGEHDSKELFKEEIILKILRIYAPISEYVG
jgi:hypothetical protein